MNMPEYAWICLNKPDSEYASGTKYAKTVNMTRFWIWHDSQYLNDTQRSEYAWACLDSVLDISRILNMPGFWIWKGSAYSKTTQGSKYAIIWEIVSE